MKVRVSKQEENSVPAWQTIYCSLILIMLVLFVMLSSYSVADKKKMSDLRGNIRGYQSIKDEINGQTPPIGYVRYQKESPVIWAKNAADSLKEVSVTSGLERYISMEKTPAGLKYKIMSDIIFPAGDATISRKVYPYFDEIVRNVKRGNISLRVEGHTDDTPVHNGDLSSNWELSAARAMNVLRYFFEKGNIVAEHLAAAGFGQYHPLVPNDTPQGRMRNRRIEIFLEIGGT